jgi:hypothetical protein
MRDMFIPITTFTSRLTFFAWLQIVTASRGARAYLSGSDPAAVDDVKFRYLSPEF